MSATWDYRVLRTHSGRSLIIEAHYVDGVVIAWADSVPLAAYSAEGLREDLDHMLRGLDRPVLDIVALEKIPRLPARTHVPGVDPSPCPDCPNCPHDGGYHTADDEHACTALGCSCDGRRL